ncbi:MAG: phosphoenolpyruvate carboxykinase (ATP) [Trueperaceae bacterium]
MNLDGHALRLSGARLHVNLVPARLVENALRAGEGVLDASGALVVDTGKFTGRSPKDKFTVRNAATETRVDWGKTNQPMDPAAFERLRADMEAHLEGRQLYVQDVNAGADPDHRVRVRVVTEYAWHSLFARNLFVDAPEAHSQPDWLVVDLPSFKADPVLHGCNTSTVIALDFEKRLVLVADTEYAGEIKKSIFSALNMVLPDADVFPMHCSANESEGGATALFFGLSGTGKTTLSADGHRHLIGDDEHGWSDAGIFNFEGGCYAKVVNLTSAAEPEIFSASQRFGALLENVILDEVTRTPDFVNVSKTENTRSAYPIEFVPNASETGMGRHPSDVVFLSADAFGVLPPIARLSTEQAMYHFLSGYTAKVAGTERGVTEPSATFSACFGAPFMSRPPVEYAQMLRRRLEQHGTRVWLLNTGWTGGGHGVGSRIKLAYTRALVRAALHGVLDDIPTETDPVFGLSVPVRAPGVPDEVLRPRDTWADPAEYDAAARKLAGMFRDNFARFAADLPPEVPAAGPVG